MLVFALANHNTSPIKLLQLLEKSLIGKRLGSFEHHEGSVSFIIFIIYVAQAVAVATISAGTGAIPVSGVGVAIDYVLIKGTIVMFVRQLGLSDIKSEDLASLDTKYTEIIKRYKSVASDKKTVKTTVTKAMGVLMGIEEVSKYIPLVGLFIAGSIAFALTLRYLLRVVNELEETAIAVWDNAAKRSIQNSKEK